MLSSLAIFWYQILLLPIFSCIHFQVWFYFTGLHLFTLKVFLHKLRLTLWNMLLTELVYPSLTYVGKKIECADIYTILRFTKHMVTLAATAIGEFKKPRCIWGFYIYQNNSTSIIGKQLALATYCICSNFWIEKFLIIVCCKKFWNQYFENF